jgi:hypothetical protein
MKLDSNQLAVGLSKKSSGLFPPSTLWRQSGIFWIDLCILQEGQLTNMFKIHIFLDLQFQFFTTEYFTFSYTVQFSCYYITCNPTTKKKMHSANTLQKSVLPLAGGRTAFQLSTVVSKLFPPCDHV